MITVVYLVILGSSHILYMIGIGLIFIHTPGQVHTKIYVLAKNQIFFMIIMIITPIAIT